MGPCSILGYFSSWGPLLAWGPGQVAPPCPPPLGGPEFDKYYIFTLIWFFVLTIIYLPFRQRCLVDLYRMNVAFVHNQLVTQHYVSYSFIGLSNQCPTQDRFAILLCFGRIFLAQQHKQELHVSIVVLLLSWTTVLTQETS